MTVQGKEKDELPLIVEYLDSFAIVRLNQPASRNSLSRQTLIELDRRVAEIAEQRNVNAIVLTGTGDVFASGANINELTTLTPSSAKEFSQLGQTVLQRIADAPQTTIAAINGYCGGGGLDLALACDLRFASVNASFAHPGGRLGIITGWGGTQRLPRLIGAARAIEMFATARRVTSSEALEIGLISYVGDPVVDCAVEFLK